MIPIVWLAATVIAIAVLMMLGRVSGRSDDEADALLAAASARRRAGGEVNVGRRIIRTRDRR